MPERTSGVTLGSKKCAWRMDMGGKPQGEEHKLWLTEGREVTEALRTQHKSQDRTTWPKPSGQKAEFHTYPQDGNTRPALHTFFKFGWWCGSLSGSSCNRNESRVLELRFLVSLFWPQKHRPFDKAFWYSPPLSSFFPPKSEPRM